MPFLEEWSRVGRAEDMLGAQESPEVIDDTL